ncbi:unnamed protein product, partial [Trypanosoma congolense IL3000]
MRTGKGRSEGQAFHRRLLSEYNTDFTLDNYVSYFELKPIVKKMEQLQKSIRQFRSAAGDSGAISEANNSLFDQLEMIELPQKNADSIGKHQTLEQQVAQQCELSARFFKELQASFQKVKKYQQRLEADLLLGVEELKHMDEEEIRAHPEELIPRLYVKAQAIMQYRALNLAALRKILKKFMERCACDSLELQRHLKDVDAVISRSTVAQPVHDLRRVALDLIALYGTVFRLTYEGTVESLTRYEYRAGMNIRRILPHSDTFFFTLRLPHQERPGD